MVNRIFKCWILLWEAKYIQVPHALQTFQPGVGHMFIIPALRKLEPEDCKTQFHNQILLKMTNVLALWGWGRRTGQPGYQMRLCLKR